MTVKSTPLNSVTAHKLYSEMADTPNVHGKQAERTQAQDPYPSRLAYMPEKRCSRAKMRSLRGTSCLAP